MERIKEKAQFEYRCKTIDELISVLEDIKDIMGDIKVGKINTIHPSINVQLFNHDDGIVVLN